VLGQHGADRLDTPPQATIRLALAAAGVLADEVHDQAAGPVELGREEGRAREAGARIVGLIARFAGGWGGRDRKDRCVAYDFATVDRDQLLLLPPSVADWLPEDHAAWFVIDVVAELDRSWFLAAYRLDGRGGAGYDPEMMLALLGLRLLRR